MTYPTHSTDDKGMSLRDWFAGQALNAVIKVHHDLCTKDALAFNNDKDMAENIALKSYEIADAMLARKENLK